MKLGTIFRFEFAYQLSRISTWLYLAVLLLFTLLMNVVTSPGDGVIANNTFHITAVTVIGGLIWLVMSASVAGEAAARDVKTRMHPLTYVAPVTKLDYLGGRFLAALAVNALLVLALPLGVLIFFYLPGIDQGVLGPFRAEPYLNVYFLIALPGAFIATALQFTFAALTREVMSSYLASLLLALVAQILAVTLAKLLGNWDLVTLLDPVGVAGIVGNELQTWAPAEKNTRLIRLEGMFLWNRILWFSLAAALLYITYLRFSFSYRARSTWRRRLKREPKQRPREMDDFAVAKAAAIAVPHVHQEFSFATGLRQTVSIAMISFGRIARNPVGLTLIAGIALISVMFSHRIMTELGIPLLPTTSQMVAYLTAPVGDLGTPWVVIPLLIIYFSGELVWREREAGISDIADAAPVREWVLLMGKFLGLGLIIVVWIVILMTGGILMQLRLGYENWDFGLYLRALLGLQLADYLVFALLALVVHVVVNRKHLGHLVMLLVLGFLAFPSTFGAEHNLLIFGKDPGWWYTDMRGFGPTLGPWLWFKLYWASWALLLAVVAGLLWARGREQGGKYRLQLAMYRFKGTTRWIAISGAGLILSLGSFIFYNTNVRNDYLTGSDINERKVAYERLYAKYKNVAQPQLIAAKLHVELHPDRQQADIRGIYTVVNKSAVAIDSIHLGSISGMGAEEVKFDRPAAQVVIDKDLGHQIYALEQKLLPGDTLRIDFAVHYRQRGFGNSGTSGMVMNNGTCFTNYDLLPVIGYQPFRELKDPVLRKRYKLASRPAVPSLDDHKARQKPFSADQIILETTIGTAKDEVAVAPGRLNKSWTSGDRRYFHYTTDAPIGSEFSILSANYAVKESRWKDVAIRIYYHPAHAQNLGRMLHSLKASLQYFTERFGPYPFGHLTVVERPGTGGGATADASIIYYGEQYALLTPDDSAGGFDLPYYILAHEMAHQWWGMARLTPANVEGAGVLIEGLAVYSGMQVLQKNYGEGHLRRYIDYLHSAYEMPRSLATASLLRADEDFLYYRKGGLALWTLSRYLGKEELNGALRRLLEKAGSKQELPTTLDLLREIRSVTPDSLDYLLDDLFKKNTYWRLKTKQFMVEQTRAGQWEVTLKVQAQKVVIGKTGEEKEEPMNDLLEIGIYEKGQVAEEPLYLRMHRIRSGEQTIKVTVPRKPTSAGIDPNHLMIDLRLDDNMIELDGE